MKKVFLFLMLGIISNSFTSAQKDLLKAVKNGDIEEIHAALDVGAQINEKNEEGDTPLIKAAKTENVEVVRFLIRNGARVNEHNRQNITALITAAYYGYPSIVAVLLDHGANINHQDANNNSALMWAIKNRKADVVKVLLEQKADLTLRAHDGATPLLLAKDPDIAKLLIDHGAKPSEKNNKGETLLHMAAEQGNEYIVRFLLAKNADPNVNDKYGQTPLHNVARTESTPARKGSILVAQALLKAGAQVNPQTNAGYTPLIEATLYRKYDLVRLLTRNGADTNAQDKLGNTALIYSVQVPQRARKLAHFLVDQGAKPEISNKRGKTAVDFAAHIKFNDLVQFFLENMEEAPRPQQRSTSISTQKWYEILHISSAANEREIKQAYRRLARRYHPDKWTPDKGTKDEATERFKQIQNAYETAQAEKGFH